MRPILVYAEQPRHHVHYQPIRGTRTMRNRSTRGYLQQSRALSEVPALRTLEELSGRIEQIATQVESRWFCCVRNGTACEGPVPCTQAAAECEIGDWER